MAYQRYSVRVAPKFGTFLDISHGVRKNFLNLNVADVGAKKRFNHVLRRICQGKCVFVRKNYFDLFFSVLKKF
jgi:hypothetical protein